MTPSQTMPRFAVFSALAVLAVLLVAPGREAVADSQFDAYGPTPIAHEEVNLEGLRSSLPETDAIGFTTKLSLKHDLDSLLDSFYEYRQGKGEESLPTLRERFADLLSSTLALLKDDDPKLFRKLLDAQGHLWLTISDPVRFHAAVNDEKNSRVAFQRKD